MKQSFYKKLIISSMLLATIPFHHVSAHKVDFNISYLYSGNTQTYIKEVNQAKGNITTTSPSYFNLNSDGSLKLTPQIDSNFIQTMHNQGIKVVPFVSNHWDRNLGRSALKNEENLSSEIASIIDKYHLDGVNVDIENVTEVDRDSYTNFVKLLRSKIPVTKEVSVAVAANPNGWTKGWQASYDYKALSKYADYLMLMAYDESYEGSPEGPVSSYNWVERSIVYTLSQGVPNNKLVLGIPFYGRYWKVGASNGGNGITNKQIYQLVEKYHGQVMMDPTTMSANAVVTINKNDPSTTIGSTTFGPGTYHIWFESDETIEQKIGLVHKYNLKGTGNWSLGQEQDSIWENYGKWLSDDELSSDGYHAPLTNVFLDAQSHWAKDDIQSVYQKGWMQGKNENYFGVNEALTRGQAAVIFVRALGLKSKEPIQKSSFKDIKNNYWAKEEIEIAKQHGIINGSANGAFYPNEPLLRDQMAVILDRVINKDHESISSNVSSPYSDVPSNYWAIDSMVRLKNQGIFNGYNDGRFGPNDVIKRAQMASLLNRIADIISPNNVQDYEVVSGDTLLKIAAKFGTTVEALKQANSLTSDVIFVGQILKIPTTENETKDNTTDNSADNQQTDATENPNEQQNQMNYTTYTVVSGDTLSKIANQFHVTVDSIKKANNLTSDMIYIGQSLQIPVSSINTENPTDGPIPNVLTFGNSGQNVMELQNNLGILGYFTATSTGYYGSMTTDAVKSFQSAYLLSITGNVDNTTKNEIEHAITKKKMMVEALNYIGVPYLWSGTTPNGFDCSGFVYYLFSKYGVNIERTSSQELFNMGKVIEKDSVQPGDLVFFAIDQPSIISHVGFYLGDGKFISATSSKGIWTYSINDTYWSKYYVGAKRVY